MSTIKQVQVTINGQTYNLTLNSSTGKYEGTLTASADSSYPQSGHYFPVTAKATNTAGTSSTADHTHSTVGTGLRLFVAEKVTPTIQIMSPTLSAFVTNSTPTLKFKVLDNSNGQASGYSGIDKASLILKVNGAVVDNSKVTWEDTSGGFIGSYIPTTALPEGSNTVTVDIKDNDKNSAAQTSVTFTVDTVAPSLTLTSPEDGAIVNSSALVLSGKTDDATSKPVSVTVKLGSGAAESVIVNSDGTFTKQLTLSEGANTVTVTATDSAGKQTVITRTVTLDTSAPIFKSVEIRANGEIVSASNPVSAGTTYTISVEVE